MTIYSSGFYVTSSNAGTEIFSLTSTGEEPKKILRLLYTNAYTSDMVLNIRLERETIAENIFIPVLANALPERIIQLNLSIPVGMTISGILTPRVMGSQGTLVGFVEYEIAP